MPPVINPNIKERVALLEQNLPAQVPPTDSKTGAAASRLGNSPPGLPSRNGTKPNLAPNAAPRGTGPATAGLDANALLAANSARDPSITAELVAPTHAEPKPAGTASPLTTHQNKQDLSPVPAKDLSASPLETSQQGPSNVQSKRPAPAGSESTLAVPAQQQHVQQPAQQHILQPAQQPPNKAALARSEQSEVINEFDQNAQKTVSDFQKQQQIERDTHSILARIQAVTQLAAMISDAIKASVKKWVEAAKSN